MPQTKKELQAQGKKNRAAGVRFEAKVREDLERMGWTVDKWTNTVDYERLKVVPAKRKYNPFKKVMVIGTGFPDFVAFRKNEKGYEVIGVEVKRKGYLDQSEKSMCEWLLLSKTFARILVARAQLVGRKIEVVYEDFTKKYAKKSNKA